MFADYADGPYETRFFDGTVFGWDELDLLARYGCPTAKLRAQAKVWWRSHGSRSRFQIVGRLAPTSLPYYLITTGAADPTRTAGTRCSSMISAPRNGPLASARRA